MTKIHSNVFWLLILLLADWRSLSTTRTTSASGLTRAFNESTRYQHRAFNTSCKWLEHPQLFHPCLSQNQIQKMQAKISTGTKESHWTSLFSVSCCYVTLQITSSPAPPSVRVFLYTPVLVGGDVGSDIKCRLSQKVSAVKEYQRWWCCCQTTFNSIVPEKNAFLWRHVGGSMLREKCQLLHGDENILDLCAAVVNFWF